RIFAARNAGNARRYTANCGNTELVDVVLIEGEAENADRLLVGLEAAERFRVIAVNINRGTISADTHAGLFRILLVEAARDQQVKRAGGLAACSENLLFEDFARAKIGRAHV